MRDEQGPSTPMGRRLELQVLLSVSGYGYLFILAPGLFGSRLRIVQAADLWEVGQCHAVSFEQDPGRDKGMTIALQETANRNKGSVTRRSESPLNPEASSKATRTRSARKTLNKPFC